MNTTRTHGIDTRNKDIDSAYWEGARYYTAEMDRAKAAGDTALVAKLDAEYRILNAAYHRYVYAN